MGDITWDLAVLFVLFGCGAIGMGACLIFMYREFLAGRYIYLSGTVTFNGVITGPGLVIAGIAGIVVGSIVFLPAALIALAALIVAAVRWRQGKLFPPATNDGGNGCHAG